MGGWVGVCGRVASSRRVSLYALDFADLLLQLCASQCIDSPRPWVLAALRLHYFMMHV
jgi:hypothetical protein